MRDSDGRAAAWLVLIGAGGTMASFNIWHALHAWLPGFLAWLVGLAPVLIAMGLSHIVAAYHGGRFLKTVTFGVMLGAMVLSVRATGYVVRPAFGQLWWLFGAVVDSAALVALQVILTPARRAAARAAQGATPEAAGEPPQEPAQEPAEEPSRRPRQGPGRISQEPDAAAARAAYRKSKRAGQPLSDRALGEKFSRSRKWGSYRIAEVEGGPHLTGQARQETAS